MMKYKKLSEETLAHIEKCELTGESIVEYIDGKKPEKLIKIPAELYFKEDAEKDPALK